MPVDALGRSVALSDDGNTAIAGGNYDDRSARGGASVFVRSAGVWSQQGANLIGTGGFPPGGQGWSVALSADGNTAAVSAPSDTGQYGAVWAFERSEGTWQQQGDKLRGSGFVGIAPQEGASVALSGDGGTLLISGPGDAHNGAVWVFVLHSGPYIAPQGVVNGATFLPGIAPGAWITIQGSNLSVTTRSWNQADFEGSSLPTQLDGVRDLRRKDGLARTRRRVAHRPCGQRHARPGLLQLRHPGILAVQRYPYGTGRPGPWQKLNGGWGEIRRRDGTIMKQ
jgi:hypothetical protein